MEDEHVCAAWAAGCHMVRPHSILTPYQSGLPRKRGSGQRTLILQHALVALQIALNFQTWDGAMQLNRARFALNNNCGYVLQAPPPVLPKNDLAKRATVGESFEVWPPRGLAPPEKLRVVVLSADHLPKREGERCLREPWDDLEVWEYSS